VSGRRALIIGGSVGGLFAAGLLRAAGWEVAVFERSAEDLAERGAGIGTREDLFRILRRIGIAPDPSAGVQVKSRLCLDRNGTVVHERVVPATNSAWDRIYRPLKDALPAASYHAGMRFEDFAESGGGVIAHFAGGVSAEGDVLIGADGLSSTVRRLLAPDAEPRYAGYVCWRGVIEESLLPADIHAQLFEHFTFGLPEDELFLCLPMPGRGADTRAGRRRFHWVWFRAADEVLALPALCTDATGRCHGTSIPPPLIRAEVIDELRAHAGAVLAPQLAAIVALTSLPLLHPIYDLDSRRIGFGRAALLGDAAFVARPHVGTGVTKAARDAECLADALAADPDPVAAIASYDRERRAFGSALVARSRELGAYLEARARGTGPAAPQDPETVLREYGAAGSLADSAFATPRASAPPGA
jgi:2-polyprenyl-6-methoxyphenol hydroxylase-like FAD-dependent oxidoreductase